MKPPTWLEVIFEALGFTALLGIFYVGLIILAAYMGAI